MAARRRQNGGAAAERSRLEAGGEPCRGLCCHPMPSLVPGDQVCSGIRASEYWRGTCEDIGK